MPIVKGRPALRKWEVIRFGHPTAKESPLSLQHTASTLSMPTAPNSSGWRQWPMARPGRRTRIAVKALDEAYLLQPTWSPDGSKIAYAPARLLYTGPRVLDTKLYIMNADGTDQKHLTHLVCRLLLEKKK